MLKRIALSLTLIVGFAIPAAAEECAELDIEDRTVVSETIADGVYTAIVGEFLWVYYGTEAPEFGEEADVSVSVSIDGATGATVCPDGIVTVHRPEADETPSEGSEKPADEVVDLPAEFPDFQPLIDGLIRLLPFGVHVN